MSSNTVGPIDPSIDLTSLWATVILSEPSEDDESIFGALPLYALEEYYHDKLRLAILFGVRIGAAVLTLIAMHLISKRNRTKMLFLANQMSLIVLIIHAALYIRFLLGPFASLMLKVTLMYDGGSFNLETGVSVASNVFMLFMILSVQTSLAIQTRSVFHAWLKSRVYITIALILISLLVSFFWIFHTVVSSRKLLIPSFNMDPYQWTRLASDVAFASSISIASVVLLGKLAVAIKLRKTLGKKPLGYTKVLMIMSTQSLVVPAILIIANYALPQKNSWILSGVTYLVVVLSLPLSSLWATSVTDSKSDTAHNYYLQSALESNTTQKRIPAFLARLRPFSSVKHDSESQTTEPAMPSPGSDDVTFSQGGFGSHEKV